ncbi:hypothetical protein KR009_011220 [Drosophila setifemur]|nr:hypothetical protein KR009_011220 [Drosophila setifemur]
MAIAFRLGLLQKCLNLCCVRQCRLHHGCAQGPLSRLMREMENSSGPGPNETRKKPLGDSSSHYSLRPLNSFTERRAPFRVNTSANANAVRMHPVVRGLTNSISEESHRHLSLAESMGYLDQILCTKPSGPLPVKIFKASDQDSLAGILKCRTPLQQHTDSMRNRIVMKMVDDSQDSLLCKQVKGLFLEDIKDLPSEVTTEQETPVEEPQPRSLMAMLKRVIFSGQFDDKEPTHGENVRNERLSRIQSEIGWNGLRPCRRYSDPFGVDRVNDTLQASHAYHMRIVCSKKIAPYNPNLGETEKKPKKDNLPRRKTDPMTSRIANNEQARLERLIQQESLRGSHLPRDASEPRDPVA